MCILLVYFYPESFRELLIVQYSEKGSHTYKLEQQAWINFIDFLDDCSGVLIHNDEIYSIKIFICFQMEKLDVA